MTTKLGVLALREEAELGVVLVGPTAMRTPRTANIRHQNGTLEQCRKTEVPFNSSLKVTPSLHGAFHLANKLAK